MIVPPFSFTRLPLPGITVRSVIWSVSAVAGVAVYVLLYRRRRRQEGAMPPRHPDRYAALSDEDRAAWEAIEGGWLGDVGLAILDSEEGP